MKFDRVRLRFQDAAVAPRDHRSYTITLDATTATKVIDAYGEIVSETAVVTPPGELERLEACVTEAGLHQIGPSDPPPPGTGGSSYGLTLFHDGAIVMEGQQVRFGGETYGSLRGQLRPLVDVLNRLFQSGGQRY